MKNISLSGKGAFRAYPTLAIGGVPLRGVGCGIAIHWRAFPALRETEHCPAPAVCLVCRKGEVSTLSLICMRA